MAPPLNLGILAHVDAGKTSLTERLLYAAGAIDSIGAVDAGTTRTDTMALERERGITIRAAVTSCRVDGTRLNIVDTPGHAEFIAEVDRSLAVLDGAILVISAVEGIQPQTRVLLRALRRITLPCIVLVNKIDRPGARGLELVDQLRTELDLECAAVQVPSGLGTPVAATRPLRESDDTAIERLAETVGEHGVAEYLERGTGCLPDLLALAKQQARRGGLAPVLFGSAITGAGVDDLLPALAAWLPHDDTECATEDDVRSGVVFAVERPAAGPKRSLVRMYGGTLSTRQRVPLTRAGQRGPAQRVTGLAVYDQGAELPVKQVGAGEIAVVTGWEASRVGDRFGERPQRSERDRFAAPTLEVVAEPVDGDGTALYAALGRIAERDPSLGLRRVGGTIRLALYGEVQREVILDTLRRDFAVDARLSPSTPVYIERVTGSGESVEEIGRGAPYPTTLGVRVAPAEPGNGVRFSLDVEAGSLLRPFWAAIRAGVQHALGSGPHGWKVPDCSVLVTRSGYAAPITSAAHFRNVTPLVVAAALTAAGTVVCEPLQAYELDVPADWLSAACRLVDAQGGHVGGSVVRGSRAEVTGEIPVAKLHRLQQRLPALAHGEASLVSRPAGFAPLRGTPPRGLPADPDPYDRAEYLRRITRGH